MTEKIAIIGLGYVGLPLALALAEKFDDVTGFDIKAARIEALKQGKDETNEADLAQLQSTSLTFTSDLKDLEESTFYIVSVPTPIDDNKQPDLSPLLAASKTVGGVLKKGDVVVFESTVYPGVTQDVCGPALAAASGLKQGEDFKLGYSPERINPGDKEHTIEKITKVVSGEDDETLERVANVYSAVITAGIHKAPSIKVAESAKVIENIQRDLNIALMNELSIIFDRLDIRTKDVLEAAGTKWNFLPFTPGLVGGHCIGVDPYYLTTCAAKTGYHAEVILAGRRINDGMGAFVAEKVKKLLTRGEILPQKAKVGILGLTFKENVPDLRNSKVPDIIRELQKDGVAPLIHDPLADPDEAHDEYRLDLNTLEEMSDLDVVILAVPHKVYLEREEGTIRSLIKKGGIVIDVKSILCPDNYQDYLYWSL